MPFTIDPKLIENDEARLEENASGNLEIVHVPSGTTLEIDSSGQVSGLGSLNETSNEYNVSDNNSNKIFSVDKSSGNLDITGTVTENSSL